MNPWLKLCLFMVMLATTGAAHWLRPLWVSGYRSNRRTIPGDALGRENHPFGYVSIPQQTGYSAAHAPDDLGVGMQAP